MQQPRDLGTLRDPLFESPGEMARLIASHPWSRTPLGPPEEWPQSLRTAVRIVLTSRFAMWMGWGRDLSIFYNDAYASMTLGAKHPWALGRPVREVWAEIWDQLEPRIRQVTARGSATWDERLLLFLERSGYREETYHTFSYSPLSDDAGATVGLLCVVSEETERVIGERRLEVLHQLATHISGADSTGQVLRAINECLSKDARDLPFTLTYLLDETGTPALRAVTGLLPDHPAVLAGDPGAPPQLPRPGARSSRAALWPLESVLESGKARVVDLAPELNWPAGPWQKPPRQAVVMPITRVAGRPEGCFIAGLNRFRPFDDAYRHYVGLFVGQVSAALVSASAHEDERRRAEALAELDRAKTTFFSNVSHEFRTPLTLMLAPTEDAIMSGRALEGRELETVHRNQLRLLKLVNTLLEFSRAEAGRARASYEQVDLPQLTADLSSTFRAAIERAGLRFEVQTESISEPVFVDPQMWEVVLLNLLSNALKFTFEGQITVRVGPAGEHAARLCVSDTGVGIAEHEQSRVFERFHRIEGSRSRTHEGSGIGLSLVQDLVKLHGGEIEVESELGRGTTFTITIPTGAAHLPSERIASASSARSGDAAAPFVAEALRWLPEGKGLSEHPPSADAAHANRLVRGASPDVRVLIADDNADMRDYLRRLLSPLYSVDTVENGRQALAYVQMQRPQLIITDVMMPELDGFGLIQKLRANPAFCRIPIIVLSARAGEDAVIEGIQGGADDYLTKPFSARELLARVQMRLELDRLGRRLDEERSSLAALFAQAPLPISVLRGMDLVFEVANAAYQRAIGGRELVGKRMSDALPELADQGFESLARSVMATGKSYVAYEMPVQINKQGALEQTYWTFIYSPIPGENERIDGVIAIINDVTEQVIARQRLEALAQEAGSANRAKDEFLAMLGHELRNPLAPMLTALQLLRLRGHSSREQAVLERQVAHLARLVDDLLDISRITRGKIELTKHKLEISEVILRAMEVASPLLEQTHHRVDLEVPKSGLCVEADLDRMAQVVSNLLTNAAKYSDPHSRILVRAERSSSLVRISVKDEGIGIDPQMIGGIFDAFVQQPQTLDRARGGLGLGLTIVRSFVEKHGGSVRAESAGIGRGSEFIVELPALDVADAPASSGTLSRPEQRLGRVLDKRILVVDDNEDAAMILKQALEELGYHVAVAHDGPSALDAARGFAPDVALLDIGLPVMDGYELAQKLRETRHGSLPPLRLVAMTGYGQEKDRERSRRAGFEQHLVKPLDLSLIAKAIEGPAAAQG